jgi:orotate phosphoribosyltransferase
MNTQYAIVQNLLEIGAVKLSPNAPFRWASGILSPIYCDNRKTLSFPEVRNMIKEELAILAKTFEKFDFIAGVATAGIPYGMLVADALDKPFIYVRQKPKEHGMKNRVEGQMTPNAKVLVVEDLISTGMSSLDAVEALRSEGAEVVGVISVFSYGLPEAENAFDAANCDYQSLSNYETLLDYALSEKIIDAETLKVLQKWRENPKAWGV